MNICWKHNREMSNPDYCVDCNGKPPEKPNAYLKEIREASVKLSYAFDFNNEAVRNEIALKWEHKLIYLLKRENYKII